MATSQADIAETLSLIESAKLPHPAGPLLRSFVEEAMSPAAAALYVQKGIQAGDVRSLVSNWIFIVESVTQHGHAPPSPDAATQRDIMKRDAGRCCITGKKGSFLDPLIVLPVLPIPSRWTEERAGISNMLHVFFGPPYRDWWLSYAKNPKRMDSRHNHWLVRRSAAKAFAEGRLRLNRLAPSMVEYKIEHVITGPDKPVEIDGMFPLLGDHSRTYIGKLDPRFVGTHARLARSIRLLQLATESGVNSHSALSDPFYNNQRRPRAASNSPSSSGLKTFINGFITGAFLTVWTLLPSNVRVQTYKLLRKIGERWYGKPDDFVSVQRLPFGMYLKYHGIFDMYRNEFNALQMVRKSTSIPVPRPLDVVSEPRDEDDDLTGGYLLTTRVPGVPLAACLYVLSDEDYRAIALQMKDYLSQLRDIPKEVNPNMAICNTLGAACRDMRIRDCSPIGPFVDEAAFSQELRFSDEPSRRGHKVVFTHADLNPRNILVDRVRLSDGDMGWRISGIVDWETAGFYPEYWDYTKAMFEGFRWPSRHNDMVKEVFSEFGDYSRELDVEKRSWESGDGV